MIVMEKIYKLFFLRENGYTFPDSLLKAQKLREELMELRKEGKLDKVEELVFRKMNRSYFWSENPKPVEYWKKTGAYHDINFPEDKMRNQFCLCGYCNKVWEKLGDIFCEFLERDVSEDIDNFLKDFKKFTKLQYIYVGLFGRIRKLDPKIARKHYKFNVLGSFHIFPLTSRAHRIREAPTYPPQKYDIEEDDFRMKMKQRFCPCFICNELIIIETSVQ